MAKSKAKNQGRARKQKGGSWESKLAKDLSYYSSHGNEFRRVVGSGAYMGGQNRAKNLNINMGAQIALSGDILGPDGWPYSIECKNTKAYPRFHLMLDKGDPVVDGFIWESTVDAFWTKTIPLVALKRTFRGEFMMVPSYLVKLFEDLGQERRHLRENWSHLSYISGGGEFHPDWPEVPQFSKYWTLMDCTFFCFHCDLFWEAGTKYLEERQEIEKRIAQKENEQS